MKKWLQNNFLPMWAKESVLRDNWRLERENQLLQQRLNEVEAYANGLRTGLRAVKRCTDTGRGGKA